MNTTNLRFPSNKVRDIERTYRGELRNLYPEGEVGAMLRMLFEAYAGWDTAHYLLHRDGTVNQSVLLKLHWALADLKRHRPIQYIIGHTTFAGCRIAVDERVLIPRPETEEIVSRLVRCGLRPHRIADLCCGSGCIAIALAKALPEADVIAVDLSADCLDITRRNAEANKVAVRCLQHDVLQADDIAEAAGWADSHGIDLVVSNPPYVCHSERDAMLPNVLDYEPASALFVPDNDPLLFYRAIAQFASHHLSANGTLVLEINEHYPDEVLALLKAEGFHATLQHDFNNKPRSITATKA